MKTITIIKLLMLILMGGVAVVGGSWLLEYRDSVHTENRGVAAYEKGNYREAIEIFENLLTALPEQDADRHQRLRHYLARSYKNIADDPGLPLAESIKLYRKAAEYDESVIDNEQILKLLQPRQESIPAWQ